jgi:polyphosphate glucokinase
MENPLTPQRILSIDIGGTGIKACILDRQGDMLDDYRKIATPENPGPENVLHAIMSLAAQFGEFDAVSAGFPGYVRDGVVYTAPNLDTLAWHGVNLNFLLEHKLGRPSCVVNDADLQGLGFAEGKGLEMVMTLGTGFGTALMLNGVLLPHLELAHLPVTKSKDYDAWIGEAALQKVGEKKWNKRMEKVLDTFRTVVNYDKLYISGGNAKRLTVAMKSNEKIVNNREGIRGGARLWRQDFLSSR